MRQLAARTDDDGFTLIELLVVMIIIGILAAIAIPLYLNQRNKGYEATAKSDAQAIATDIASALTDGNPTAAVAVTLDNGASTTVNNLPNTVAINGNVLNSKVSGYDSVKGGVATDGTWCVAVASKQGGAGVGVEQRGGLQKGKCTANAVTAGSFTYSTF